MHCPRTIHGANSIPCILTPHIRMLGRTQPSRYFLEIVSPRTKQRPDSKGQSVAICRPRSSAALGTMGNSRLFGKNRSACHRSCMIRAGMQAHFWQTTRKKRPRTHTICHEGTTLDIGPSYVATGARGYLSGTPAVGRPLRRCPFFLALIAISQVPLELTIRRPTEAWPAFGATFWSDRQQHATIIPKSTALWVGTKL